MAELPEAPGPEANGQVTKDQEIRAVLTDLEGSMENIDAVVAYLNRRLAESSAAAAGDQEVVLP